MVRVHFLNGIHPRFYLVVLFLLITGAAGVGIYVITNRPEPAHEFQIATSVFPVYDITKNIVGDQIEVTQMLPSGVSPHTFEPTAGDISEVSQADLAILIGNLGPFEEEMLKGNDDVKMLYLYDYIDDLQEDSGDFNPHYWLSVSNAKTIATVVYEQVSEMDSFNKVIYRKNYEAYMETLSELEKELQNDVANSNIKGIVTFHDAFGYLAEDLDIDVLATIEPFPGKEPTPVYLSELGKIIETNNVRVLFSEPQLSDSVIVPLADDYGVRVYTLDPLGGVEGRDSYESLMRYNVTTIIQAYDETSN